MFGADDAGSGDWSCLAPHVFRPMVNEELHAGELVKRANLSISGTLRRASLTHWTRSRSPMDACCSPRACAASAWRSTAMPRPRACAPRPTMSARYHRWPAWSLRCSATYRSMPTSRRDFPVAALRRPRQPMQARCSLPTSPNSGSRGESGLGTIWHHGLRFPSGTPQRGHRPGDKCL